MSSTSGATASTPGASNPLGSTTTATTGGGPSGFMSSLLGGGQGGQPQQGSSSSSQPPQPTHPTFAQALTLQPGYNPLTGGLASSDANEILSKPKLRELVRQIAPNERLEPDVEEVLIEIANDFLENMVASGTALARHRQSDTLEIKDIALYLERNWDMKIPGYSHILEDRTYKRPAMSEAHKKRLAEIKKTREGSREQKRKGRKRKTTAVEERAD
jgi:transcription initiation factor TFIID subunit 12